jgi:Uncharacterized protein, putative amidase
MQLHLQTWPDVERYLAKSQSIIIPIGSTEQHGPNGLIGTDALCAEAVAKGVGDKAEALVAPTISVGMAQHHLGFPGSMTLMPSTLIAVIKDWVFSLSRHGFRRFYFINGHGGNIATVTAAFSEIYASRAWTGRATRPRCNAGCATGGRPTASPPCRASSTAARREPCHPLGGLHDLASLPRGGPAHAPGARGGADGEFADAADYRRRFPDGRIGSNPGLATAEAGKRLLDLAVVGLTADYQRWAA